jgi:hypothetical protein
MPETILRVARENWVTLLMLGGMIVAWLFLKTKGTQLESVAEFEQRVRSGQPVVVEVFANT